MYNSGKGMTYPTQLQPIMARKLNRLILAMKILRHPIVLTEGVRTVARQNKLYAQGRTAPGNIVTNAKGGQSLHNYGVAFDVAFLVDGSASWDERLPWKLLGKVGKALGLEWGGDWTQINDRPHFQYLAGYTLADFQSGKVDYSKFK
jgi:peptidoglycan L-alanyl-D-glutamate endopeptidase CwlK